MKEEPENEKKYTDYDNPGGVEDVLEDDNSIKSEEAAVLEPVECEIIDYGIVEHLEDEYILSESIDCTETLDSDNPECEKSCDKQLDLEDSETKSDYNSFIIEQGQTQGTPFDVLCQYCGDAYKLKSQLDTHIYKKHKSAIKQKTFPCPMCEKVFPERSALRGHIQRHNPTPKTIPCEICGKTFRSNRNVMQHSKIHVKEKPFKVKFENNLDLLLLKFYFILILV